MTRFLPAVLELAWHQLEAHPPSRTGGWVSLELQLSLGQHNLLLAEDPAGNRHLLIPVSAEAKQVEDRVSKGVQLGRVSVERKGRPMTFVDLVCLKPHLHDVFSRVVTEVVNRLEATSQPFLVCQAVMEEFRELLERAPRAVLGEELILGLIGELFYLEQLAQRNPEAIQLWAGPMGARHDFCGVHHALEVKTTRAHSGRMFRVSREDQLDRPTGGGDLHVGTVLLEASRDGDLSIPTIVQRLTESGVSRTALLQLLSTVGYDETQSAAYDNFRYSLRDERLYLVDETFPKLTVTELVGGRLPPGVLDLTYVIDLTGSNPAPLALPRRAAVLDRLAGDLA